MVVIISASLSFPVKQLRDFFFMWDSLGQNLFDSGSC